MANREYLGDGVYAETEDGMIKLVTNNGMRDMAVIYLEVEVYGALERYVRKQLDARPVDTSGKSGGSDG